MASTDLRIFDVVPATKENPKPEPKLHAVVSVDGDGDTAKRAAKAQLKEAGFTVRSLNWGPNLSGKHELVAYVTKEI